jgi:CPA2 family monovalent cation:H+ antiporter-2
MDGHGQLTEFAIVALAALICGIALARLRQPAVVGYILAGVILGPSGLGLVANREGVDLLAELGVLMLLFLVGMELSLANFKTVWRIALIATGAQVAATLAAMWLMGAVLGWPIELSILLGFALSLSSTAVVVKMLEAIGESRHSIGEIVIGILVAQDLAVVPMIIIVDAMGGEPMSTLRLAVLVIAALALVGAVLLLSRRRIHLPFTRVIEGSSDLTPLTGLVFCFVAASVTGLIGLSPAYGAFLAGLVLGNSSVRPLMIRHTEPIQSVLLMVFFLSIGLLLDLRFMLDNLGAVLVLLLLIAVAKTVLNAAILKFLGQSWPNAFLAGALLAQIGEFSFLLAAIGRSSGTIDDYNHKFVVCMTVLSLALSPFWLVSARRLQRIALLGVTSSRETIRILYGSETRQLADLISPIWGFLRERLRRADARAMVGDPQPADAAPAATPPRAERGNDADPKRPETDA